MANRSAVADFHHLPYLRKGTLFCTPFAYLGTKNRTGTRHIGGVQDYGFYGSTRLFVFFLFFGDLLKASQYIGSVTDRSAHTVPRRLWDLGGSGMWCVVIVIVIVIGGLKV